MHMKTFAWEEYLSSHLHLPPHYYLAIVELVRRRVKLQREMRDLESFSFFKGFFVYVLLSCVCRANGVYPPFSCQKRIDGEVITALHLILIQSHLFLSFHSFKSHHSFAFYLSKVRWMGGLWQSFNCQESFPKWRLFPWDFG